MLLDKKGFEVGEPRPGLGLGRFTNLAALPGLAHGVSTRRGPDFSPPISAPEHATAAGELAAAIGLREAAWMRQVHGNCVLVAEDGGPQGEADGLVTTRPGLALLGRSADCPLLLVAGPAAGVRAAGIAHASWRGTVQQVAARMIAALLDLSGLRADQLVAAIAPSAGPCCYEVGPEVQQAALAGIGPQAAGFFSRREGSLYFDLWQANVDQLLRAGLRRENIHVAELCTICRADLFPSYRREGSAAGRFAAAIGWRA